MNTRDQEREETNETRFESWLAEYLEESGEIDRIETFEETGIMTRNRGLVVRLNDGTKFQVTIVEDRRGW